MHRHQGARRLEGISRSLQELSLTDTSSLSVVCGLKQEVGEVYRSLDQEQERLLEGSRWWSWGVTSSLLLLSLLSLAALVASSLTSRTCSQGSYMAWNTLSNPVTFSYVNGPPPI